MVLSYAMEQVERLLVCAGEQAMRLVQLSEKQETKMPGRHEATGHFGFY